MLITIRTGNYGTLERVLSFANTLFRELEEAEAKSGLPERVDRARVSATIAEQPIFYPVANIEYATQIARDRNTRPSVRCDADAPSPVADIDEFAHRG